ncbi:hypothetical protein [Microbacterium thalassium]|uniref:Uncharacterized protein n=1 Tax=Microbacterium thalassium TaxID=362649 RepID=A0A7X0FS54_9MICO|nr:hypothetical protein [Microbacterium thalassium]MBB6392694.1 hypothetical protein [Microbacterium thalassium]GLK23075.1 hypothetical protein GCM10017607_03930 [Microbacterium thalassium]
MLRLRNLAIVLLAASTLALGACSSTGSSSPTDDTSSSSSDSSTDDSSADSDTDDSGASSGGAGSATFTVDGQTWEYPSYLCVTGYENTQSDVYSFSSTSFTTVDGDKIQALVDVRDDSGQDRLSGDGVVYEITVYDTENATVDILATGTEGVTITDTTVTVDGTFSDLDGVSHSIQVDATCGS